MVLTVLMALAGASLGVVLASVTVPHIRWLPILSASTLVILAAVALLLMDVTNFAAALVFVAALVASSTAYAAALWRALMPELPNSFGWFYRVALTRPAYLRDLYAAREAADAHADYAVHSS